MTNEEKAKEIVNHVLPCPCPSGYSVMMHGYELEKIARLAAEWKEQQMHEIIKRVNENSTHQFELGYKKAQEEMIKKSCTAFCKVCDTKECEDYESDTCNWLKKFKQVMKGK